MIRPASLGVFAPRERAFPRDWEPNANPDPGDEGVGPNSSEGFGNTHVMFSSLTPPPVQAWSGWPVEWATPHWGSYLGMPEMQRRSSTVYNAINKNAGILATMPRYRLRDGRIVEPAPWMRNPQPEVYNGWIEAFRQVVKSYYGGEAFLWATSRMGSDPTDPVRTWVMLNPSWVNVDILGQIRTIRLNGEDITADTLHIRYDSWPGDARGHGPLESSATNLFGVEAMERYASDLTVRGGIPWAVLTAEGRTLTAAQSADARGQFVAARMSSNGAPAVLSGGFKLDTLTFSPKDMALLELRSYEETRLANLLDAPAAILDLPSGNTMTYSNVQDARDMHWQIGLRVRAGELMEAISQWAFPPNESIELNADEYTRPPLAERITYYERMEALGAMTVDQIRAAERLDTGPGARRGMTSIGATA